MRVDDDTDRLLAKLAPESVRRTLVRAGCFLCAYELIKSEIIHKVHEFFWHGIKDGRHVYDEADYQRDVISRNPSKFRASCDWLVEMNALSAEQVTALEEIHKHRHEIAHELPKLIVDADFDIRSDLLLEAVECVRALGVFWGSIDVDSDQRWDGKEVDYDGIKSGSYLLMEHLISIAGLDQATGE